MANLNSIQDAIDSLTHWFNTRAWDPYKFSSPIVALFIQFASRPFKKKLAGKYDQKLSTLGITDSGTREQALYVAKDWDLQVSYFATMISAFFSIAAITRAFSNSTRFTVVLIAVFLPATLIYVSVLKADLGELSLPLASGAERRGRFLAWMYKRKWSYADIYSRILMVVNVILLLLILISMPAKP
jgi:hypothetical protein